MACAVQIKANLYYNRLLSPPSNCQATENNSTFLDQFTDPLTLLSSGSKNIIILGSINMHIDNVKDQETQMLLDWLLAFKLIQHVKIPTHNRGHTLDVIIILTEDGPFQPANTIAGQSVHLKPQKLKLKLKSKDSNNTWRGSQSSQQRDAQNPQLNHTNQRSVS